MPFGWKSPAKIMYAQWIPIITQFALGGFRDTADQVAPAENQENWRKSKSAT